MGGQEGTRLSSVLSDVTEGPAPPSDLTNAVWREEADVKVLTSAARAVGHVAGACGVLQAAATAERLRFLGRHRPSVTPAC